MRERRSEERGSEGGRERASEGARERGRERAREGEMEMEREREREGASERRGRDREFCLMGKGDPRNNLFLFRAIIMFYYFLSVQVL